MARKRQIDPDIWTSEQVIKLSLEARLLFIGMISMADDDGRLKCSALSLKVSIFPADSWDLEIITQWRDEIIASKLIIHYEVDGCELACLPNFRKYQYMTKVFPSKLPKPPELSTGDELVNNKLITEESHLYGIGIDNGIGIGIDDGKTNKSIMGNLLNLPGWGKSHPKTDQAWLSEFLAEFPDFNVSLIKACRDYHSNKKSHTIGTWKTRLRRWAENNRKFKESHGKNRSNGRELPKTYTKSPDYSDG